MKPKDEVNAGKKVWVVPQIVERVALADAMVTKDRAVFEGVILGVHVGPRS